MAGGGGGDVREGAIVNRPAPHRPAQHPVSRAMPVVGPAVAVLAEGAAEQFAAERATIGAQIGTPNQIEAVMSQMAKRKGEFVDP